MKVKSVGGAQTPNARTVADNARKPRAGEDRPIDYARVQAERFMQTARVATARERRVLINFMLADHGFAVRKTIERSRRHIGCGDALGLLLIWNEARKMLKESSTSAEERLELLAYLEQLDAGIDQYAERPQS